MQVPIYKPTGLRKTSVFDIRESWHKRKRALLTLFIKETWKRHRQMFRGILIIPFRIVLSARLLSVNDRLKPKILSLYLLVLLKCLKLRHGKGTFLK
jgi:hypothetical protein